MRRGKLTEQAYRYLRDGIMRGEFPTGSVLAETEIARRLGSSRTPVRHALGLLLQEGLLEIAPRRQVIVRGFTDEHRSEILLLREALEAVAVRRACEVMTLEDIDYLRLLLIRQRRAAREGRHDDFLELDEEFHLRIGEGAQLPILRAFLNQLRGRPGCEDRGREAARCSRPGRRGARAPGRRARAARRRHGACTARRAPPPNRVLGRTAPAAPDARGSRDVTSAFTLREAHVLDRAGSFDGPCDVRVEGGRIAAVGRGLPSDGASVDFSGLWLMPGVFDCHDHVTFSTVDVNEVLSTPVTQWALESAANARTTVEAGVTFVRDLAGADRGLRAGIAAGHVPGPTLQISVVLICQTGGHGDGYLSGAGLEINLTPDYPGRPPYVVDGEDSMRHAVRAVLRAGADWIKLATTGGLVSEHDQPLVAELTPEEIAVAVFEASRKGKPVAAHAYGGDGLTNAVLAGVRSIEHGGFLTEEQATLMAERGCFLVPTLSAMRDCLRWAEDGVLTPTQCEKILGFGLDIGSCVRIAKEHGVPLASGTDYISREQHGNNLEELALMHQAGLTVEEALLAATAGGAELCGVADDYGRIEPGFVFDAIVFDRDPGDLSELAVGGVFQAGRPVVRHPRLAEALP
ncbi:MAG TPA: amidohydrolase family protein [Gaiellaceae bacterium]|nr:amidohydrolase family protein [Gaiellaceae bacterium]